MLVKTLTSFIFLISLPLWGQSLGTQSADEINFERENESFQKLQDEESDILLSRTYRRGPHLIYDCENKHFACVSPLSRQSCEEDRADDLEKKRLELRCAPLKEFASADECERTQQNVMQRLVQKDFCWNLNERTLYEY